MFRLGDYVTPKSELDVNYGKTGRVVDYGFGGVYVVFESTVTFYFNWMLK